MPDSTAPRTYVLSDGKGRPSWQADPAIAKAWDRLVEQSQRLGFTSIAGGWAMQPKPHGEVRLGTSPEEAITFSDKTPASAAMTAEWWLDMLERERSNR